MSTGHSKTIVRVGSGGEQKTTPQGPNQRREVLSEEDYSQTLSKVIQRNYYPELPQLEAQVALQSAREGSDFVKVIATRHAARALQEHEEIALEQEDQEERDQTHDGLRKRPRRLEHETLTNFHLRVTSEDNAEYESIQQDEVEKRKQERLRTIRQAMAFLTTGSGIGGSANPSQILPAETPLILASDQFNPSPHRHVLTLQETERESQTENPFFFPPNNQNQNVSASSEMPSPSQKALTWNGSHRRQDDQQSTSDINTKSELALMPPPSQKQPSQKSVVLRTETKVHTTTGHGITPVEYIPKDQLQKKIVPSATRFQNQHLLMSTTTKGSTNLEDRFDSDSSSTTTTTDHYSATENSSDTDLDATPRHSLQTERKQALKRRRKENETLIALTPVIVPGRGGEEDEPIMTWGEVSSTPLVLPRALEEEVGGERSAAPIFNVAEETSRDAATQTALAVLQARGRRAAAASTPTHRRFTGGKGALYHPNRSLSRSSASLLHRTRNLSSSSLTPARSSSALGTALRASYARSSNRTTSSSNSSRRRGKRPKQPSNQTHRTAHAATPQLLTKSSPS